MHEADINNYVTTLVNSRMKHMQDFAEQLRSQEKDSSFYANALLSIKTVIDHFEIVEEAFEDFSIEKLTDCGNNDYRFRWHLGIATQSKNKMPAYIHYFDIYDFKTSYIINPLAKKLKNYTMVSDCTVSLTKEGLLKNVMFDSCVISKDNKKIFTTYNSQFELVSITRIYQNILTGQPIFNHKSYCDNLEMELYFIDLFLSDGFKNLSEQLPELTIPSAYNLNSDEFNIRLKVAEMIFI